jgi:ubiquinone biosynthesis protein UbiJ
MRSTAFTMPPLSSFAPSFDALFGASLPHPFDALPATINHLLAAEPWARTQLVAHAGKTLCVVVEPLRIGLTVTPEGMVARADPAVAPDTTVTVPASALPRVLTGGIDAVMRDVRIDGDAEFAQLVSTLARTLRWDAEEDLSKIVGDAASHRLVSAFRSARGEIRRTGERAAANVTEYLLEENPQLVRPRAVEALADALRTLRDDLARLEKRVDRLTLATAPGR